MQLFLQLVEKVDTKNYKKYTRQQERWCKIAGVKKHYGVVIAGYLIFNEKLRYFSTKQEPSKILDFYESNVYSNYKNL